MLRSHAPNFQPSSKTNGTRTQAIQVHAELSKAKILAESLVMEMKLLGSEKEKLQIKAPHAGVVLDYQIEQRLAGKPVQMGEQLLEIADVESSRELELFIEEKHLGYVENSLQAPKDDLTPGNVNLTFRMHAKPEDLHQASITNIPATNITFQYDKRYIKCHAKILNVSTQLQLGAEFDGNIKCQAESIASLICKEPWRNFKLFLLN